MSDSPPAELVTTDVTAPSGSVFWCKKRLKRSSPKSPFFVSGCKWDAQASKFAGFRWKAGSRRPLCSVFRFRAGKAANSSPPACHRFVTACHRFVTALFGAAELVTTDVTAPSGSVFWCKKRLKRSSPKSPFFVSGCKWDAQASKFAGFRWKLQTTTLLSSPLSGRKSGEFQPAEHVTACHRFVTALFGAEKCAKKRPAKPAPRLRWVCKSWLILPVVICLSQSRS